MTPSARARLGLAAVAAASLIAGGSLTARAASAAPGEGADFKTRAVEALVASSTKSASPDELAPSTKSRAAAKEAAPGADRPADAPDTAPQRLSADAAADCAALGFDGTPTHDHVWLHWHDTGEASYAVWRQRLDGAWKQIGTSTGTSYLDRTINPRGLTDYRIVAGGVTCDLVYSVTMQTADGAGVPDAVYGGASTDGAGTGQLMEQDIYSYAMTVGIGGSDPAFSPDGRRVASTQQDAGLMWNLQVTDPARPTGVLENLTQPAGFLGVEAAWSPDGRSVAYTRYAVDDQGAVSSPELRILDVATETDRLVAGSAGLIQPDWRSATTLVAAGAELGEGLVTIPVAGGTKAPVAGTANAGYPEVGPDGRTWYVEGDGTNSSLRVMDARGSISISESSTTSWFERPRITPDNTVYVVQIDRNDPEDPTDNTFMVKDVGSTEATAIGAPRDQTLLGFHGFDVRQPKSKGTSDVVGNAGGDILARDSSGNLWAYPSTEDTFAGTRVKVGTGWNIYNAYLAAGDLNGDDRGDILARDKEGRLWRYDGRGAGKVASRVQIGAGWTTYLPLAPGDFNGDAKADVIARASNGDLWLYPGTGTGTLGARIRLGGGWQVMNSIVGVGDFDLDNDADLVAREASTSKLWLYPGNGKGGFSARRQVGTGWNTFKGIAGPELLGLNPYVYAKTADGRLLAYTVVGDGRFDGNEVYLVGTGWSTYSFTS